MHSPTDIANMALSRLGEPEISDFGENSPAAILVRRHYELVRDSLLRSHQWSFAATRAELTRLSDAPPFGWSYAYTLPSDCLHVNTLNGDEAKRTESHFRIEGKNLLTNTASAQITYTRRITDTGQFDALFTEALILKLAAALAQPLTQSSQKKSEILAEYAQLALPEAETVDAQEEDPVIRTISSQSRQVASRTLGAFGSRTGRDYNAELPTDPGIHKGDPGSDGWTPIFAVVSDGERRVVEITGWEGGTGTEPETGYLAPTGIVAAIGDAIDIRGAIGLTGDDGLDAWSPIFSIQMDGERRVFQVEDWTGGEGTKPATGGYLSAGGLTDTIGDAVDIRGPAGSGDMSGPGVPVVADNLASWTGTSGSDIEDSGIAKSAVSSSITKTDFLTITGAVDLDQMEIDVAANNAKVTNATHTGDVTGATALTIANDAVTFAKMQNITTQRVIGRDTAGTGNPEEVQLTNLLDWISGSVSEGDILYRGAGTWQRLAAGSNGQSLTLASGVPAWADAALASAGEVSYFARNTAPFGWLKANGAAVSRTTYAGLFSAIGTTFGVGDGSTTFALPDLRGEFLRGWDDSRGVDTSRAFGSAQADELKSHTHAHPDSLTIVAGALAAGGTIGTRSTGTTNATGGAETRPRNIALLACIKY